MRHIYFCILFLLVSIPSFAQKEKSSEPKIYIAVEEMPEFPGGMNALPTFIAQNFNLPKYPAILDSLTNLAITFVIGPSGEVQDIEPLNRVHPLIDQEAQRVLQIMPRWKPGKQDGELVYVKYTVPIRVPAPQHVPSFLQGKSPYYYYYDEEAYESGVYIGYLEGLEFPYGNKALATFIQKNYKIPEAAKRGKVSGIAKFSFIINPKGEVTRVKSISNLGSGVEENLVGVLEKMPNWKTGNLTAISHYVKRTVEIEIVHGKATFRGIVPSEFDNPGIKE
ncbi:energy transducer TonB [Rufibacter sediminis]|uniref:Energy transducer TonB n=1 Tax=Rufibacter sediminis TaxID=2762756 RepID=A0ABR6VT26_9BACT|nr:energy transducer TonB [Rufibacter sediminis]MBC3540362.1 energy transducer TonB [Rufibacter sediminis]